MISGHKKQAQRLHSLFQSGNIPHALLFSGPESVGKRTVALWFLKMVNCFHEHGPCDVCENCRGIEKEVHPDILKVTPEKKEIQLHQIEEITERVYFKGLKARFKGVLIDDAHLMNLQAQNSLLKILEEPPGDTVMVLVTEHPRILLPTVASRSFEFKFSFVPEKEIKDFVRDEEAASLSLGRPGVAMSCCYFPEERERLKKEKEEAEAMAGGSVPSRFSIAKKVVKEERVEGFLGALLKVMEKKMKEGLQKSEDTKDRREVIKEIERTIFLHKKTNINKQLALERIATKIK